MSKLRKAVSRSHLRRLAQDVVPTAPGDLPPPKTLGKLSPRGHRRRARAVEPVPLGSSSAANENGDSAHNEPESIQQARTRLRALIEQATQGAPPASVGIVLAIVNQETGNHAAANALIDEYGLDRLFGIQKFSSPKNS